MYELSIKLSSIFRIVKDRIKFKQYAMMIILSSTQWQPPIDCRERERGRERERNVHCIEINEPNHITIVIIIVMERASEQLNKKQT